MITGMNLLERFFCTECETKWMLNCVIFPPDLINIMLRFCFLSLDE